MATWYGISVTEVKFVAWRDKEKIIGDFDEIKPHRALHRRRRRVDQ